MDFYIAMAFAIFFQLMADRKKVVQSADAIAKAYITIERQAQVNPTLAAAIEKQRLKG
jgi:hypothetical protein